MKRIAKKLKSKKGETLVEILVAILVIALAAGLFATMYSAAMKTNLTARRQDEALRDAVGALEEKWDKNEKGEEATVTYTPGEGADTGAENGVKVDVFTKNGLTIYK